jgi:hypothetical protein
MAAKESRPVDSSFGEFPEPQVINSELDHAGYEFDHGVVGKVAERLGPDVVVATIMVDSGTSALACLRERSKCGFAKMLSR